MAKKKQVDAGQPFRPDLTYFDPSDTVGDKTQANSAKPNPEYEALTKRLDEMAAQLRAAQNTNAALMAQPTIVNPPKFRTEIDPNALPDPLENPKEYALALGKQNKEIAEGVVAQSRMTQDQAQTEAQKIANLWNRFGAMDIYKPYAANPDQVEFVANKVVAEKRAQGLDVQKYVFMGSDQFMADVVAQYDKTFGKPKVAGAEDDEGDTTDDTDDNRTVGIMGGVETGGKPVTAAAPTAAQDTADMFQDVRAWQQKSGFSR